MIENCLQWIIATEFDKNIGTMQIKNVTAKKPMIAMDLIFELYPFYDHEEGYRKLHIRIFALQNYVTINIKESWNILLREDIDYDVDEEEPRIRKGKGYIEGETSWQHVVHHDCWTDVLGTIFNTYHGRICSIAALRCDEGWYTRHEMIDKDLEEMQELVKQRDKRDYSRQFNSDNCILPFKEPSKEKAK